MCVVEGGGRLFGRPGGGCCGFGGAGFALAAARPADLFVLRGVGAEEAAHPAADAGGDFGDALGFRLRVVERGRQLRAQFFGRALEGAQFRDHRLELRESDAAQRERGVLGPDACDLFGFADDCIDGFAFRHV